VRESCRGRFLTMIVLGLMGTLSICACTSRGLYETARDDAHRACLNRPAGLERDKCLEQNSHSYDEYTRERERVQREEEEK
jgi:hypothetical protein